VFLSNAGQKAWYIFHNKQRNVESIAETNETCPFYAGIYIARSGHYFRLVGHNADGFSVEAGKTHQNVLGKFFVYFEKTVFVHNNIDDFLHVVRTVRVVGNNFIKKLLT
jgi:hypothetical protein